MIIDYGETPDDVAVRLTGMHFDELASWPIGEFVPVVIEADGRTIYSHRPSDNPNHVELHYA